MDQGEVHSGLLKHGPVAQHTCTATTTGWTAPCILNKAGLTINLLNGLADAILQFAQEMLNALDLLAFHPSIRLCWSGSQA
ncbi:hypothetical protein GCM10010981_16540 [Dyella nitratireducens]|uniref:Uncharacterized protein n=1 Tax=Dyella nitratireducens TaxID=1849580 RepID=A0ABQ1FT23_9GAMM|nr:hypothetical protein GCM10010981_16540 [Dyella nitratireducens]GLQ43281.1 hypothetical protein GCM10007902_31310 [Dyella nitratireducens]